MKRRNYFTKRIKFGRYRPKTPLVEGVGMVWLTQYLQGYNINKIAKMAKRSTDTVSKYMAKAAAKLVDDAHSSVMNELFPLASQLYKKYLEVQLAKLEKGEDADLGAAERIMQGMYVFDSPILSEAIAPAEAEPEVESVAMLITKLKTKDRELPEPIKVKQLEEVTTIVEGEVEDGDKS